MTAETIQIETDDTPTPARLGERLLWLVAVTVFWISIYEGCLWMAPQAPKIGQMNFAWEENIPFLPWMIVPYLSIFPLCIWATFACTTQDELRRYFKRVFLAVTLAGLYFNAFPLQFAYERPEVTGIFAPLYRLLDMADAPYNQAPSLHIAGMMIAWTVLHAHLRGKAQLLLTIWCFLLGISVVFTWQHHVFDIPTGAALAVICCFAIPGKHVFVETKPYKHVRTRRHFSLGGKYFLLSVAGKMLAMAKPPFSLILFWPATSKALVAMSYMLRGPRTFRKHKGRQTASASFLFTPYRVLAGIVRRRYIAGTDAFNEIIPGLFIGRALKDEEAEEALKAGITAVLDLTCECPEATPFLERTIYKNIQVLDLTPPSVEHLIDACIFIDEVRGQDKKPKGVVYVHCAIGFSRSATVAAAWLLHTGRADTVKQAVEMVAAQRPCAVLSPDYVTRLDEFAAQQAG